MRAAPSGLHVAAGFASGYVHAQRSQSDDCDSVLLVALDAADVGRPGTRRALQTPRITHHRQLPAIVNKLLGFFVISPAVTVGDTPCLSSRGRKSFGT